jgi:hypothetical protein
MKKLENIPKKEIFLAPEGYFEALPGRIRARITAEAGVAAQPFIFRYKLQYALPALLICVLGGLWLTNDRRPEDAASLLATVHTEAIVAYLNESDITTDDLLESVSFSTTDLHEIENEAYTINLDSKELEEAFDDIDLENI